MDKFDRGIVYKDREVIVKHTLYTDGTINTVAMGELVRCKDCKHNPKLEWFGCPMASLSEKQRPETAWCWKGERKDGEQHE